VVLGLKFLNADAARIAETSNPPLWSGLRSRMQAASNPEIVDAALGFLDCDRRQRLREPDQVTGRR
jgi:hypothetical protein